MYKILLADDEGIVLDSLSFIIQKNFGNRCVIECAKTGREVIEIADDFRPDIAIMDIQMPGINGIEAMKELKKRNSSALFIVMTAYDKFAYAREALNLGVVEYLTKPVNHSVVVGTLSKAMALIENQREKRNNELMIKERLETVVPLIESGLIYSLVFEDDFFGDVEKYKELLGITAQYGMMLVVEWGDDVQDNKLSNPVGASVKAHSFYEPFKETIKEFFNCVVGPAMANHILVFIPSENEELEYEERIGMIERSRNLATKLKKWLDVRFRIGIGSIRPINELGDSCKEAINALKQSRGRVVHVDDLPIGCDYEKDYPVAMERALFDKVNRGNVTGAINEANNFFDWMLQYHRDSSMDIKLKVLEFVLFAEKAAFESGGMTYYFKYRSDYLSKLIEMQGYPQLRAWFIEKITEACRNISTKREEKLSGVIAIAKEYIDRNYNKNISLDEVSKEVDISPYYFSKLFKEKAGENFIEYVTKHRIDTAKKLLEKPELSIKEICLEVGYGDPNYFSRIFKKYVGLSPTEYRERN